MVVDPLVGRVVVGFQKVLVERGETDRQIVRHRHPVEARGGLGRQVRARAEGDLGIFDLEAAAEVEHVIPVGPGGRVVLFDQLHALRAAADGLAVDAVVVVEVAADVRRAALVLLGDDLFDLGVEKFAQFDIRVAELKIRHPLALGVHREIFRVGLEPLLGGVVFVGLEDEVVRAPRRNQLAGDVAVAGAEPRPPAAAGHEDPVAARIIHQHTARDEPRAAVEIRGGEARNVRIFEFFEARIRIGGDAFAPADGVPPAAEELIQKVVDRERRPEIPFAVNVDVAVFRTHPPLAGLQRRLIRRGALADVDRVLRVLGGEVGAGDPIQILGEVFQRRGINFPERLRRHDPVVAFAVFREHDLAAQAQGRRQRRQQANDLFHVHPRRVGYVKVFPVV